MKHWIRLYWSTFTISMEASARRLAKDVGLSPATVQRIWQKYGLRPHRLEHFKFSTDPRFETKLADIVGLYLDPPESSCGQFLDLVPERSTG